MRHYTLTNLTHNDVYTVTHDNKRMRDVIDDYMKGVVWEIDDCSVITNNEHNTVWVLTVSCKRFTLELQIKKENYT